MTGLHNQHQKSPVHLAWVYMQFHFYGRIQFYCIITTSESQSSVTEEFHRVTVGVLMVYALHYAFGMFFNHFNIL